MIELQWWGPSRPPNSISIHLSLGGLERSFPQTCLQVFDFWVETALAVCKADFLSSWQEETLVRDVVLFVKMLCFALKSDFSREVFGGQ